MILRSPAAHLLSMVLAAAMLAGAGTPAFPDTPRTPDDPFPAPLPRTAGVIVDVAEFASLPDSNGLPARMMLLTHEPGGRRLFLNDMRGPLYSISSDGRTVLPYLDLRSPRWALEPDYFQINEKGFQSFAFHPQWNIPGTPGYGRFYTFSDTWNIDPAPDFSVGDRRSRRLHDTVLLEWRARDPAAPFYDGGPPRELLRIAQPGRHHNGGMLAFNPLARPGEPDYGMLYASVADGTYGDPFRLAQRLDSVFGKLLRIDPLGTNGPGGRYGIPADNPFAQDGGFGTLGEVYAYGLRNPQRFTWDPENGNLFLVDIGHNALEEINVVTPGANLGWSKWEGSFRAIPRKLRPVSFFLDLNDRRSDPAITYPVVEYDHTDGLLRKGVAITGAVVYRGDDIPQLEGMLLFGELVGGEVFYINADALRENGGQEPMRRLLFVHRHRIKTLIDLIRDKNREQKAVEVATRADLRFGTGPDGQVFLLNKRDGTVRRLAARPGAGERPGIHLSGLATWIEAGASRDFRVTAALPRSRGDEPYTVVVEAPPGTGFDPACTANTSERPVSRSAPTLHYTLHECSAAAGVVQARLLEHTGGNVLATVGATVWTGTTPPEPRRRQKKRRMVELAVLAKELPEGASDRFSVTVTNLDPAHGYMVRVRYRGSLAARREDCTRDETPPPSVTSAVFGGETSRTETFTVYGCTPGRGWIRSGVRKVVEGVEMDPQLDISPRVYLTVTPDAP